jgi:hypothetical protein
MVLPDTLAHRISELLSLPDIHRVQFRVCRRIPFSRFVGGKRLAGLTLWNRVWVVEDRWPDLELVIHELVHVLQFRKNPIVFPLRYIVDHLRYGYDANPAEVEARTTASRVLATLMGDSIR